MRHLLGKRMLVLLAAVVGFVTTGGSASADNVAYINASGGSVNYLTGYGHTVTNFNNPIGLTLGDLAGYDAILIASNSVFSEATNIANVAQQFANAGGGVVLTQFAFQGGWQVSGGITAPGYSPFTNDPLSSGYFITSNLGTIYDPASPLLDGVNTANVTTDFQADVGLDPGATLVADWTSGRHAIGYNLLGNNAVVGLNLFPHDFYTSDPDTQRLVANAISFSSNPQTAAIPEPMTLAVFGGLAVAGLAGYRRRQAKA